MFTYSKDSYEVKRPWKELKCPGTNLQIWQKVGENSKQSLEQENYGMLIQGIVFNLPDSGNVMKRSTQGDMNMKQFITR